MDTELIAERCLGLGISPIQLARALGVSTVAVRSLERGSNHGNLTVHRVQLLADTLGVPLRSLFTDDTDSSHDAARASEPQAEAALALLGKRIDPQDYASAMGCTPQEAHKTFCALRDRRAQHGVNVNYSGGTWGLVPNRSLLSHSQVQALERAHMTRSRINVTEAALLKKIIDRDDGLRADALTHAQLPSLARLLRLGWIEHRAGRYRPAKDVRDSLGLKSREAARERTTTTESNRRGAPKRAPSRATPRKGAV